MKRKAKRQHSLFRKIIIPLIAVMIGQSVIYFCTTFYGGISETLKRNAEDVLKERVLNQERDLETKFTTQWTNFTVSTNKINQIYDSLCASLDTKLYEDKEMKKKLLTEVSASLIAMLRANEVTGVFLILNDAEEYRSLEDEQGKTQGHYGLCIRDYSPLSDYTENEDLLVTRCPSSMIANINCSVDTWWEALYTFDSETPGDYYYKPLELAYENPGVDTDNLAYFDGAHNFGKTDQSVVTYSLPLVDETGYPYAVLGVELTTDYLKTLIPSSSLYGQNAGCYCLVQYQEDTDEYRIVAYNGALFQQCFGTADTINCEWSDGQILMENANQSDLDLCGSISNLQIYNHNTPYEQEKLGLIGFVKTDILYAVNTEVQKNLLLVSGIVLVFGCIAVLIISRKLTSPINRLSKKVREADGSAELQLERLNIDEIDDLVESIEGLNDKINRTAIRTEFFSRMSHDMRTPMNAIIGFSSPEVLESAQLPQMKQYMEKIHDSGSYLLSLINEVLDMSKIETQRMELREETMTQAELFSAVIPIIREVAKEKGVHFVTQIQESDAVFFGDRQRLSQIFMNLLSNAVKFTEKNDTVRLKVKEIERTEQNITNQIVVSDEGCGMSEEFQKKMYEPFAQEGLKSGGTGLGLAIAKQLVELMRGTMDCNSVLGQGTTFTICLTNRRSKEKVKSIQTTVPESDTKKEAQEKLRGKRVLLCEDHPLNIQVARRLLERKGCLVEEAHDGAEGVEKFTLSAIHTYDWILMDIRMPVMDGLEAARRIRALEREDAKTIPIIAMTANAFREDVEESRSVGMNEHLSKPIDPKILYITLEKYA